MFEIMSADEAALQINDGDCICVNSFVGIENPIELHEAIHRRFLKEGSPKNLTLVSSAGFGVFDENRSAEGYIRDGAVSKIICGHFGAMLSTKRLILEDRFEAYNLPLGCISHAIRAQASGVPGALSKVGLDIFVDPRQEGPGINHLSTSDDYVKAVEVDGEEFLYYKLPKLTAALIKGTAADHKGNISFDDMFMSGDALSICQAVRANGGKVIVQVDRLVATPARPRNTIIPGCLVDIIVVTEPEERPVAYRALTGGFEIPYEEWKYARKSGMLARITMTVESGGIGGFPASGTVFGAMIGAASVYDMANQFDLYDNGGLDICFMGAFEVDQYGNVNAHKSPSMYPGIGGFANITAKTPTVVFCLTFNTKGLSASRKGDAVTILENGKIPKFVEKVGSISFSAKRARENGQRVLYITERCVFGLGERGLKLLEVYPGIDRQKDILDLLPFEVE